MLVICYMFTGRKVSENCTPMLAIHGMFTAKQASEKCTPTKNVCERSVACSQLSKYLKNVHLSGNILYLFSLGATWATGMKRVRSPG